jgi:AAA domain/TrwC relaxase
MATVAAKLGGSASAVLAYLKDEDRTLAYFDASDGPYVFSEVWGRYAETLGISRGITRRQFNDIHHGRWNGEQLAHVGYRQVASDECEEGVSEAARTAWIDVPMAVPKELSVLFVAASPELRVKLNEVVMRGAKAAADVIENYAKLARIPVKTLAHAGARNTKQQGSATQRVTADLAIIPTMQYAARPVDGKMADPHVHVHLTVATMCEVGGRVYTADSYGVMNKRNAEHRDAAFLGEIARGLEELGIELEYGDWATARNGKLRWTVKGIDPGLARHWSSNAERAWKIRKDFEEVYGYPMSDVAVLREMYRTRRRKSGIDKEQDRGVARAWGRWAEDARNNGFELSPPRVMGLSAEPRDPYKAMGILHARLMSANGLCREEAVFSGSEIRPAVARCAVGLGFTPEQLDAYTSNLTASDNLHGLVRVRSANDPDHQYWTTSAVIAAEARIANAASERAGRIVDHPDELSIARSLKAAKVKLDREQVEAVQEMCSGKGWVNITGHAGTGKSTAIRAAVAAYREAAKRSGKEPPKIAVVSAAAKIAGDTGRSIGADYWGSVESILRQIEPTAEKGKAARRSRNSTFVPDENTIVVIEECSQLDTFKAEKLLNAIGPARVIAVGDLAQRGAISASGWWADHIGRFGAKELTMVRRQKNQNDVRDYQLIRQGKAPDALRNLAARGRVHVSEDKAHRVVEVMADYVEHRQGWRAQDIRIITDADNQTVDLLNRYVQRHRLHRGEVGKEAFEVHDLEQDRRWSLRENDQVIFLSAYFEKGQMPVKNGTQGVILSIDDRNRRARIRVPDGDNGHRVVRVSLNAHDKRQPVGLSYAVHSQKFQGAEVPVALVMPGMGQTNANSAYSMVTRSTHESHVYVSRDLHGPDPVNALGKAWSEREVKQSALSKLNEIRREEAARVKRPVRDIELVEAPELEDVELDPVSMLRDLHLDRLESEINNKRERRMSHEIVDEYRERQYRLDLGL